MKTVFIIAILIIIILWICYDDQKEHFTECDNQSKPEDQIAAMGQTARDACSRISTEAENIKAKYDGINGIIDSFNPLSVFKSGDNATEDVMTNILNTNLSTCDVTKIENACVNSSASTQVNSIDNTMCPMCTNPPSHWTPDDITKLCSYSNITQENVATISQRCSIQSTIESLLSKTASVDAQALASVLQEADGLMSGDNSYKADNCNVINVDMSSVEYLENKSSCANEISVDQKNNLSVCGSATNILQNNKLESLQECLIGVEKQTEKTNDTKSKTLSDKKVDQSSAALTADSLLSSVISCALVIMIIVVVTVFKGSDVATDENFLKTASEGIEMYGKKI